MGPARPLTRLSGVHYLPEPMTSIDIDLNEMNAGMFYFLLNSVVVPRPIAWVS